MIKTDYPRKCRIKMVNISKVLGFCRGSTVIACLSILGVSPAASAESEFGLAVEKLEYLFEFDVSVFEIEATYGRESSFIGLKSESRYDSGLYGASENQLFYFRSFNERVSGLIGVRYVDSDNGGDTSAILGVDAGLPFDIGLLVLTFIDSDYAEGRIELVRPTQLSQRIELLPKIDLRAYSNDVELVTLELRLAYAATDRLKTYFGASWFQLVGTESDQSELSALAGLSYER